MLHGITIICHQLPAIAITEYIIIPIYSYFIPHFSWYSMILSIIFPWGFHGDTGSPWADRGLWAHQVWTIQLIASDGETLGGPAHFLSLEEDGWRMLEVSWEN